MRNTFRAATLVLCLSLSVSLHADPQPKNELRHPKSACIAEISGGEYPHYSVTRNGKVIYAPESDGISSSVFSPGGTRLAFVGSEVNGVDIPGGEMYPVVILECKSGRLRGFNLRSVSGKVSWKSESLIEYADEDSAEITQIGVAE